MKICQWTDLCEKVCRWPPQNCKKWPGWPPTFLYWPAGPEYKSVNGLFLSSQRLGSGWWWKWPKRNKVKICNRSQIMQRIQNLHATDPGNILEHKKILAKSFLKTSKKHWWFHLSQIRGWLSVWRKYMRLLGLDLPVLYSIPLNISGGGTQNDKIIQVYFSFCMPLPQGCSRNWKSPYSANFRKVSKGGRGALPFVHNGKKLFCFHLFFLDLRFV